MITKRFFGKSGGKDVFAYELANKDKSLKAEIITYGGILRTLVYNGTDVVLGRDTIEEYENNAGCFGALIGRNSNRIFGGEFSLNGKKYTLAKNDNGVCNLHGGNIGYNKRVWDAKEVDGDEPSLVLSLFDPDKTEGFPGNVNVKVTYTVTCGNQLKIHYEAESDADTVINLTNHSYFNLNGHASGNTGNHTFKMEASFYTPNTKDCYPYGEILSVEGTPFDFRMAKAVGRDIEADDEQLHFGGGYDHNFVLEPSHDLTEAAVVSCPRSGIQMRVSTTQPGVQLYTGNMITPQTGKHGHPYGKRSALCLETQHFPNSMACSSFASPVLKAGETYDEETVYEFSVE